MFTGGYVIVGECSAGAVDRTLVSFIISFSAVVFFKNAWIFYSGTNGWWSVLLTLAELLIMSDQLGCYWVGSWQMIQCRTSSTGTRSRQTTRSAKCQYSVDTILNDRRGGGSKI
jgi:hypothetical protein